MFSGNFGIDDDALQAVMDVLQEKKDCKEDEKVKEKIGSKKGSKAEIETEPKEKQDDSDQEVKEVTESMILEYATDATKKVPYYKRVVLSEDDEIGYYLMYRNRDTLKEGDLTYASFYICKVYFVDTYSSKSFYLPEELAVPLMNGLKNIK